MHAVHAKLDAGQNAAELGNDLESGASLLDRAGRGLPANARGTLRRAARQLQDTTKDLSTRVTEALSIELSGLLQSAPIREHVTRSARYEIWVDRTRALYGSWYEYFPL